MLLLLSVLMLLSVSSAKAIVLDWSSASVTWTPGSLTGSFDIDPNNPGNDVTVTISGSTGNFFSSSYPQITSGFTGGLGSSTKQLDLYVDYSNTSQAITVTVTFNYSGGVSDVSYTLFDVDTGALSGKGKSATRAFVDEISSVVAVATNNTLVAPTIAVANTTYTQTSGSGTNQVITGQDVAGDFSSQGTVSIDYGTNIVSSVTFTYGEGSGTPTDPFAQGIGLYNISYTPKSKVPEVHPGLVSAMLCLFIALIKVPALLRQKRDSGPI